MPVFRKSRAGAPPGFFACEAAGLAWLAAAPGGPRVVRVLGVGSDHLDLERLSPARPTPSAARALGRALAALHDAGAPTWGALPPSYGDGSGFFGPLDDPLPMPGGTWPDWPTFYGEGRLRPLLEQGRQRGVLDGADARLVESVAARLPDLIGPAGDDRPARLHGDLWSGNVMWTTAEGAERSASPGSCDGVEAVLIDPAAHGGHREADLAMLALFGAPHLDEVLSGYAETHPLTPGWQHRVRLHQLYPLAVHAVLFGGGYVDQTRTLLRRLAGS
ncbi:fructosamine kinase [Xylanimonas oleitrophica]|uniref:Fructosamine kinase n=1 Tax=Xylanimonas oleitrophica TaxID=2607479 RepID=A0A2W5WW32_9MICO|nr:fructosamine kinase family protein [Xylanimonas oleitrophica]PZR52496.1 fructosamine kinase [Xylanimonas oleitrophica]